MVSTVEKMNYIEHHLKYEVERLIYARKRLETTTEDDKSAFYVATAAHMRSLRVFMRNTDGNTNMRGQDYNKEFKVVISKHQRISSRVSTSRYFILTRSGTKNR